MRDDETAWCWGQDNNYQLGGSFVADGTPSEVPLPPLGAPIVDLCAGFRHACVITMEDEAVCWGLNSSGQVGAGFTTPMSTGELPTKVIGLE